MSIKIEEINEFKSCLGKYIASEILCKKEVERVDPETGKITTGFIYEIKYKRGTEITDEVITDLEYLKVIGKIDSIKISNDRVLGELICSRKDVLLECVIKINSKSRKILLHAKDIMQAIECVKDWCDLNLSERYDIISIKAIKSVDILLQDDNEHDSYLLDIRIVKINGEEQMKTVLSSGKYLDDSFEYVKNELSNSYNHLELKNIFLEKGKIYKYDYIIPEDFSMNYQRDNYIS